MDSMALDYLISTRRKLHSLAELSGEEYKTADFIESELKRFGFKPKRVGTGVFCDGGSGSHRIAFRADTDALPICENVEATGLGEWAANGVMHACGHDGHTANLLNLARILGPKSQKPVRYIFQFGEEGIGGSEAMIAAGVLSDVEEIYALHLCPELESGKIGYTYGGMFAGCCEFDIEVTGKASHCASPDEGADAVRAAVFTAVEAEKSAAASSLLLNLGRIDGGSARNIIAASCKSCYSLRFYDMGTAEKVMLDIERAALAADDRYGTSHRLVTNAVYPPVVNHAYAVDRVRSVMGDRCVEAKPRNTAEDFSNYLAERTGCMVWLGVRTDKHCSPLHSDTFSFDESDLLLGTELFLKLTDSFTAK